MRIDHRIRLAVHATNGRDPIGVGARTGNETKLRKPGEVRRTLQVEASLAADLAPKLANGAGVLPGQIEYEALEVGRLGDIHGRTGSLLHFAAHAYAIATRPEEFVQNIVLIG